MVYWVLGIAFGLYAGTVLLLNVPYVQQRFSSWIGKELSELLGSRVYVGRVDIGLLNRIIVNDFQMDDRTGAPLLRVGHLSAKFDLLPLLEGKISIGTVQFFSFQASLERETPDAPPNFQFVLDALASKDTVKKETDLDLRVNSLLVRRGRVEYNVRSEEETPGRFNANHITLSNILANVSLKALQGDSINAAIKRMSLEEEQSGFDLKRLTLRLVGNGQGARVENFAIGIGSTTLLKMDTIKIAYDSLGALNRFADEVGFTFHLLPSEVTLQDISPFIPAFRDFAEPLEVEVEAQGSMNNLACHELRISSGQHFLLKGDVSLQQLSNPDKAGISGNLSQLYADPEGMAFWVRNMNGGSTEVPPALQHLGTVAFHGTVAGRFNDLVTYGMVQTDIGSLQTDLKLRSDTERGLFTYTGGVKTEAFDLGALSGNRKLGDVTFNLEVKGSHATGREPLLEMKGLIASLEYNDYTYRDITLDGEYKQGGFNGTIAVEEEYGAFRLDGAIDTAARTPVFNFTAELSHLRPHELHLSEGYEGAEISVKLRADFTGGSIDEMVGDINIDSLYYTDNERRYFLDNLRVSARSLEEGAGKRLEVESALLRGNIEGDYSYATLPAGISTLLRTYLPSLIPPATKEVTRENDFRFDLHIYDTDLLAALTRIPVKVYTHSTLKGYFNGRAQRLQVEGYFPKLNYNGKLLESGMLRCETVDGEIDARVRFNDRKEEGSMNIAVAARAKDDDLAATIDWGNNSTVTYSGKLSAVAHFLREGGQTEEPAVRQKGKRQLPPLKTVVEVRQTDIILNDTLWTVQPSEVVIDSGRVHIDDFYFSNAQQHHLRIDGVLSDQPEDTVWVDLQQINIGYVFDIADLGVNFRGEATGPAYACGVFKTPVMGADLAIHDFGLNDGLLGEAQIHGEWHNDVQGILLDADIKEGDLAHSKVYGFVYPLKPTSSLDLQITADHTCLDFIHYYMTSITPEFHGRATGDVHFYGKFKALTMEGKVDSEASLKVEVLNTTFLLKDSLLIEPGGITFQNNRIYDTEGHEGHMSGYLHYNHFKNLEYRFRFDARNMLLMDTQESYDIPFYGTVYGTGNVTIAGNPTDGVNIDVAMTTNRNTNFVYIKEGVASAVDNQFIRFVDKTPRRVLPDIVEDEQEEAEAQRAFVQQESDTDIHLNLLVDATPDATMRIIMDPLAGDYISASGEGNIRTEFYNKGDVRMFGSYRISQGTYKFSIQEVIRKDFTIKEGSSISFNGDPADATLDITASYLVPSASLNDLVPNASSYVEQTNVRVDCIMTLSGQLTSPDIALSIDFPNERNEEVQALVRNYILTDEQMNMQILYLLGIGKFYTPENVDTTSNSNMMSSVLSSTLSGQLNNALSQIIDNNNWNFGTNLSTGEKGWTDMEFETMLSGRLLNNRLIVNGNFGYRDNAIANTNFVGDFQAEWLVNRSGDIRLKAYNETNDRYYTKTNLTTQGIGIIFKKDFTHWRELLFWNKLRLKRLEKSVSARQ